MFNSLDELIAASKSYQDYAEISSFFDDRLDEIIAFIKTETDLIKYQDQLSFSFSTGVLFFKKIYERNPAFDASNEIMRSFLAKIGAIKPTTRDDVCLLFQAIIFPVDMAVKIIDQFTTLIDDYDQLEKTIAFYSLDNQDAIIARIDKTHLHRQYIVPSEEMAARLTLIFRYINISVIAGRTERNESTKWPETLLLDERNLIVNDVEILVRKLPRAQNDPQRVALIKTFLATRDLRVTRSPIGYTTQAETPTNRLYEYVAHLMCIGTTQRERYQWLMPSLSITGVYGPDENTSQDDEEDLPPYREVILSDDLLQQPDKTGKSKGHLIHVAALLRDTHIGRLFPLLFPCNEGQLKQIVGFLETKKHSDKQITALLTIKNALSISEIIRIKQFFPSAHVFRQYITLLEQFFNALTLRSVPVTVMLQELIDGLIKGGDKKAEERKRIDHTERKGEAGTPALKAISDFLSWWNALPSDLRTELENIGGLKGQLLQLHDEKVSIRECVEARSDSLLTILGFLRYYRIKCRNNVTVGTYIPFSSTLSKETKAQYDSLLTQLEFVSSNGQDSIETYPIVLILTIARSYYALEKTLFSFIFKLPNKFQAAVIQDYLEKHPQISLNTWVGRLVDEMHYAFYSNTAKAYFFATILTNVKKARPTMSLQHEAGGHYQRLISFIAVHEPSAFVFKNMAEFMDLLNALYSDNHYNRNIKLEFAQNFKFRRAILFQTADDCRHGYYFIETRRDCIDLFTHIANAKLFSSLSKLSSVISDYYSSYGSLGYIPFTDSISLFIKTTNDLKLLTRFMIDATQWSDDFAEHPSERLLPLLPTKADPKGMVKVFCDKVSLIKSPSQLLGVIKEYPLAWQEPIFSYWLEQYRDYSIENLQELNWVYSALHDKLVHIFMYIHKNYPTLIRSRDDLNQATQTYDKNQKLSAFVASAHIVIQSLEELRHLPSNFGGLDYDFLSRYLKTQEITTIFQQLQRKNPALINSLQELETATLLYPDPFRLAAYVGFMETWITFISTHEDWQKHSVFLPEEQKSVAFSLYINHLMLTETPALNNVADLAYLHHYSSLISLEQIIVIFKKVKDSAQNSIQSIPDLVHATEHYPSDHKSGIYKLFADNMTALIEKTDITASTQNAKIKVFLDDCISHLEGAKLHNCLKQIGRKITLFYNKQEHIASICASSLATRFMVQLINTHFAPIYEALYIAHPAPTLLKSNFIDEIRRINSICQEHNPQQLLITLVLTHITENPDDLPAKAWALLGGYKNHRDLYQQITNTAEEKQSSGLYFVWSTRFESYDSKNSMQENTISSQIKRKIAGF